MNEKRVSLTFEAPEEINIFDGSDRRFSPCEIEAFATGENAHTYPIQYEDLCKCAETIYDIPIVYRYDRYTDDYQGHDKQEVPMGFIKEDLKHNPICFEKKTDGRIFLKIKGLIWNKYAGDFKRIFQKSGNIKSVSVELTVIDGEEDATGKIKATEWIFEAITVLGNRIRPAVKGANIALEFSEDKRAYCEEVFSDNNIVINNSQTASTSSTKWVNPRAKLFNPILKASNREVLLSEAYLSIDNKNTQEIALSEVSFPHHKLINNELVVDIKGLKACFSKTVAQQKFSGDIKTHIVRHYKELGLTPENCEQFELTKEQYNLLFSEDDRKEVLMGKELDKTQTLENEVSEQEDIEKDIVVEEGCEDIKDTVIENANEEPEIDAEDKPEDENKEEGEDKGEDEGEGKDEDKDEDEETLEGAEEEVVEEAEKDEPIPTIEELSLKCSQLEAENEAYMSRLAEMSDYEELKAFKQDTEQKEFERQEQIKMSEVLESIKNKGFEFTEALKEELLSKRNEFENVDSWSNYVKAFAVDNISIDEDLVKFDVPKTQENKNTPCDIWGNLMNKFNN